MANASLTPICAPLSFDALKTPQPAPRQDLGMITFLDPTGTKHVAAIIDPTQEVQAKTPGAFYERDSTYLRETDGCEFPDPIEWMNRKISEVVETADDDSAPAGEVSEDITPERQTSLWGYLTAAFVGVLAIYWSMGRT